MFDRVEDTKGYEKGHKSAKLDGQDKQLEMVESQ